MVINYSKTMVHLITPNPDKSLSYLLAKEKHNSAWTLHVVGIRT
jgi:hypothetical protein